MTELQPFVFPATAQQIRTLLTDGEPWFVAADVCTVLGIGNSRQAVSCLDTDEVRQVPVTTNDGSSRTLPSNVINEPGLYSLILRSRKPEAKAFKRWITHEVLPSIRRSGSYSVSPQFAIPQTYPEALELAARQARELEAVRPKVQAFDAFLNGEGCYLIDSVANLIGARHKALWKLLYDEKILIGKGSRKRQPYALDKTLGWFEIKTHDQARTNGHAAVTTYVTPYGAEQIRLLAVKRGLIQPQLLALTGGAPT